MKAKILLLAFIVQVSMAAPPQNKPSEIKRLEFDIRPDGTHNYLYETENGIYEDQQGYPKDAETQAVQGQFQYVSPEGQVIRLTYQADENGFQPQGDHLPTPPPIPAAIQKALELIASQEKQQISRINF